MRRLFGTPAVASAVLGAMSLAGWIASHVRCRGLVWQHAGVSDAVYLDSGDLLWRRGPESGADGVRADNWRREHLLVIRGLLGQLMESPLEARCEIRLGGLRLWILGRASAPLSMAIVPLWMPATASAVLPSAWLIGFVRRRRRRHEGLCHTCGYDLRNLPTPRCPECGTERRDTVSKPTALPT
jgi:hypothetical protein